MPCNNLFNTGTLFKGVFIPKVLNNLPVSCYLTNFDFLLSHTAHFGKGIILATFGLVLSVFFLHFKKYVNIFCK